MFRILMLFLRRLWLPLIVFAGFSLMCVLVYRRLEGLNWQDALFWMIQPHAIDPKHVRNATKMFSLFVYMGAVSYTHLRHHPFCKRRLSLRRTYW